MPFVTRNSTGDITAVSLSRTDDAQQVLDALAEELLAYLEGNGVNMTTYLQAAEELLKSDDEMTRSIEDLLDGLMAKDALKADDLPAPLRAHILNRENYRQIIRSAFAKATK